MFSAIKSFISQHRQKLIFGGFLAGGTFFAFHYGKEKIQHKRVRLTRHVKEQHHLAIERLCGETVSKIMPQLKEVILKILSCSKLIESLRNKTAVDKIAVWKEIKVLSFTKLITFIYATSMLFTFLQIQLNLIGGYQFRDLDDGKTRLVEGIQDQYLNLPSHFINHGIVELCKFIKEKVSIVLENKSLQQEMSVGDVGTLFWAINLSILNDPDSPCKCLGKYLLPDKYKEDTFRTKYEFLDQVILDTKDLIEDSNITNDTETCIMEGSQFIIEEVKGFYRDTEKSRGEFHQQNKSSKKSIEKGRIFIEDGTPNTTIPMAKIIPFIDNFIQKRENDKALKWIKRLTKVVNINIMGANVFETFSSEW